MWGRTEQGFHLPTFVMSSKSSKHGSQRVAIPHFLTSAYGAFVVAQLSASCSSGRELKPAVALTKPAAQREPLFWT
jgi:hypothetical protein